MSHSNAFLLRRIGIVIVLELLLGPPAGLLAQDDVDIPRDFSQTNSVSLQLTDASRGPERWQHGLAHAFWEKDGRTTTMTVEGVPCRNLNLTADNRPKGYFYFALNPSFKHKEVSKVRIDVEYFDGFDGQQGVFGVQYDATAAGDAPLPSSKPLLPMVALNGSGKWLKASFHVRDGTFENTQNARSGFRLVASPPELTVSRVAVTLEPELANPPMPLKFDAKGEAKLRDWNVQWDANAKPKFSRMMNSTDGVRCLQIRSPGSPSGGSWRTAVYLEPGEYQFAGRVKLKDTDSPTEPSGGVMFRASSRPSAGMLSAAADWTPLTYNFTMSARDYIELVCDFRSSQGTAMFDLDSLKLIRRHESTK